MDNPIIDDDQVPEAEETLSLTDFPISQPNGVSTFQDHRNPPSSGAGEDFFEFLNGGLSDNSDDKTMSHAEDIIFCGKLVPIEEQLHRNKPPQIYQTLHRRSQQNQPVGCRRSRSESTAEIKRTKTSPLVRNSRSLDYKKMNRNSSMSSEFTTEINRDGSGKKSSSSRWYVLLFGLVKVPPSEMDIRGIKNRQVRRSTSKTPLGSSESFNLIPVTSDDHQKCSWRVLGFLSCKSSSSAAVTTPVGYMPKV